MPQPCIGSNNSAFRTSMSSVPRRTSLLSCDMPLPLIAERKIREAPYDCQGEPMTTAVLEPAEDTGVIWDQKSRRCLPDDYDYPDGCRPHPQDARETRSW